MHINIYDINELTASGAEFVRTGTSQMSIKIRGKEVAILVLGQYECPWRAAKNRSILGKSVLISFTKNTSVFIPNLSLLVTLDDLCVLIGNRIIRSD